MGTRINRIDNRLLDESKVDPLLRTVGLKDVVHHLQTKTITGDNK